MHSEQSTHDSRTALITGAGSGIGAAVARRLARGGARVALLGRTEAKLESVAAEIRDSGAPAPLVVRAHQEREAEVDEAVATVEKEFGRLDVLFNNAAIYEPGTTAAMSISDWDRILEINVRGPLLVIRAVLPMLRRQRSGVIVNNASTLGLRPVPGLAAYSTSKAALLMLTRCVALEEAANGIRVVAICPGVVDTPIHRAPAAGTDEAVEERLEQLAALHPLGRIGTAEEIAALVEYLTGDEASWITGSIVTIDGGISLQ